MDLGCPACAGRDGRPAMMVRGFRFRRCGRCRSLYVENPPSERELAALYRGEPYFAKRRHGRVAAGQAHGYADYLADRAQIEAKFDRVVSGLERHAAPGRLLDVGAGPGLLVSVARRRGWSASGLEPNPWATAHAREAIGVDVREGTLESRRLEGERFDAVTMTDVLEHLRAPGKVVAEATRVTRTGGLLAVLTPDAGALASRLLGARWPEVLKAPAHLVLFSLRGLAGLLGRHGYQVLDWHSVGKTSTVATLLDDLAPAAPAITSLARPLLGRGAIGRRTVALDPRTKFCLYARLGGGPPP